jgi:hypothetical protein
MTEERALELESVELNRILTVGVPGEALIEDHFDTGAEVAGNPIWVFRLHVTPEGGPGYGIHHRQAVSAAAVDSYPAGSTLACRIDPRDPSRIAFGERPFM